jgi:hypothetical protein
MSPDARGFVTASITTYLQQEQETILERWVVATKAAQISYPQIISEDILHQGAKLVDQLSRILGRSDYQLGPRKRLNPIGNVIGRQRAMDGVSLEAVVELFVLFRHELWVSLTEYFTEHQATPREILEVRRRVDLYLDQFIASIAYSYTRTKEEAMVGLIEKLLS